LAIEAHRRAVAAYAEAVVAPSRMFGKQRSVCIQIAEYDDFDSTFNETKQGDVTTLTVTRTPNGKKKPVLAYSYEEIERDAKHYAKESDRDAWIEKQIAKFDKEERRIAQLHSRTKLGKLEAIVDKTSEAETEAGLVLAETKPTSLEGAVALLDYFAEVAGSGNESFPDSERDDQPFAVAIARNIAKALGG
jgi:hypothetical protein